MELLNIVLYALPVYQSVAFALLLLVNGFQKRSRPRQIMGVFQLLGAFYFSFNFFYAIRFYEVLSGMYFLILPAIMLFLPFFYLYLLAITTPDFAFRKNHIWHLFLPFLILVLNIPFLFTPEPEKLSYITRGLDSGNSSGLIYYLLSIYIIGIFGILPGQLFFYLYQGIKLYRNHRVYIQDRYSFTENISLNWILALMTSLVIFFIGNQMLYLAGYSHSYFSPVIYNILMLGTMLLTGYYALLQKDLKPFTETEKEIRGFSDYNLKDSTDLENIDYQGEEPIAEVVDFNGPANVHRREKTISGSPGPDSPVLVKYAGSPLSESLKSQLIQHLEVLMKTEKVFKNESLSIEDVALRLMTNSKYVSQIINEAYGKNFYNFINAHRVEEAQILLLSGGWEKYSMLGIAQMVGFGSKSSFNSSFKKITGLTPSEFVKTNK